MTPAQSLQTYLHQHFLPLPEFARRVGMSPAGVQALIDAGAIPGPVYTTWPNGAFWSPVGGQHSGPPLGDLTHWYAPSALWWARRATVLRLAPTVAADQFRAGFVAAFCATLAAHPLGILGYPEVFANGVLDPDLTARKAAAEYQDWIDGGYAVCMRRWDAADVITKMVQRGRIIALTRSGTLETLTPDAKLDLLDAMESLEAVMLPFAPHQRPAGTPGLWIDAILARYDLGGPLAEPTTAIPDRLCA